MLINCTGVPPPAALCDISRSSLLAVCVDDNRALFLCLPSSRRQGQYAWARAGQIVAPRTVTDWFIPLLIITIGTVVLIILIIVAFCYMLSYRRKVLDMEERVRMLTQRGDLKFKDARAPENMIFMTSNQAYNGIEKGESVKWSARDQSMFGKTRMTSADRTTFERDRMLQGNADDAFDTSRTVPEPVVTRVTLSDMPVSNNLYGARE